MTQAVHKFDYANHPRLQRLVLLLDLATLAAKQALAARKIQENLHANAKLDSETLRDLGLGKSSYVGGKYTATQNLFPLVQIVSMPTHEED